MKPLLLILLLLVVAAFAASAEKRVDGDGSSSSYSCNVLKRPAGVPGQAAITMCTNVTSLPAGTMIGLEVAKRRSSLASFDCFLCEVKHSVF